MFLKDGEANPSMQLVHRNQAFNRVELNYYQSNIVRQGAAKYYCAVKSDFEIDKSNENNNIMTNSIEFPFSFQTPSQLVPET